jgi:hypothetical protein
MKARGEAPATPADAPEIELDEAFWENARIVESRPRRKASAPLRFDPGALAFYRAAGRASQASAPSSRLWRFGRRLGLQQ